ncbi:unnamed protein product [Amoebophrya sp. A120]|nr:unnamed protein product [Amoebophrya sp. A120]|eukprot:GSA120T00005317001.1
MLQFSHARPQEVTLHARFFCPASPTMARDFLSGYACSREHWYHKNERAVCVSAFFYTRRRTDFIFRTTCTVLVNSISHFLCNGFAVVTLTDRKADYLEELLIMNSSEHTDTLPKL